MKDEQLGSMCVCLSGETHESNNNRQCHVCVLCSVPFLPCLFMLKPRKRCLLGCHVLCVVAILFLGFALRDTLWKTPIFGVMSLSYETRWIAW